MTYQPRSTAAYLADGTVLTAEYFYTDARESPAVTVITHEGIVVSREVADQIWKDTGLLLDHYNVHLNIAPSEKLPDPGKKS